MFAIQIAEAASDCKPKHPPPVHLHARRGEPLYFRSLLRPVKRAEQGGTASRTFWPLAGAAQRDIAIADLDYLQLLIAQQHEQCSAAIDPAVLASSREQLQVKRLERLLHPRRRQGTAQISPKVSSDAPQRTGKRVREEISGLPAAVTVEHAP